MLNIEKEREALVAEIEIFIEEAMKAHVVERWADSYQNTKPFAYTIDAKNEVWWMKTQAHQLWQFWKAVKANEAKKLEGCVVVPVEPTDEWMASFIDAGVDDYCRQFIGKTYAVTEDEKPSIKAEWREPVRKAHALILKVVEAARGGNHE